MSLSMRKPQEPTGTMYEEQERQKMLRLNREIHEPQEPRLEWIYTGDRTKSDDYLLGKKYDGDTKSNDMPEDNEETSTVDLDNKIREDPLFLIKKKEIEQKKRILENPVRLKQLKELLERQESRQSSHKRNRHSRSRSPEQRRRSPSPRRYRRRSSSSPPPPHRRRHSPSSRTYYSASTRRDRSPPRRRHSPSPQASRPAPSTRRDRSPPRRERSPLRSTKHSDKPSKEERDRRIREMLVDGAIRNEQREHNVRSFKERDEKEEKLNELIKQRAKKKQDLSSSDDEGYDFIRPMMKQVVDDPSLKRRDLKHHHHKRK